MKPMRLTTSTTPRDRLILALLPAVAALLVAYLLAAPAADRLSAARDRHDALPDAPSLRALIASATAARDDARADLDATRATLEARRADLPKNLPPAPPLPALDRLQAFHALCADASVQVLSAERLPDAPSDAFASAPPSASAALRALPPDTARWRFVLHATYAQFRDLLAANAAAPSPTLPLSFAIAPDPVPGQPALWTLDLCL